MIIKQLYRALVPTSVRHSRFVASLKAKFLAHDWIYDAEYYEKKIEETAARSAGSIAASIVADFGVGRVVDVGCGTGALLEALRDRGCVVFGLEYSEAALRYCRARQLDVATFDLESDTFADDRTFDVAVSMEVAEHLPQTVADRYIDLLTRLSQIVIFTAALPGQGGTDHVNEQPPSYWLTKFRERGFEHAEGQSQLWRDTWRAAESVEWWYHQNLMIFRRIRPS